MTITYDDVKDDSVLFRTLTGLDSLPVKYLWTNPVLFHRQDAKDASFIDFFFAFLASLRKDLSSICHQQLPRETHNFELDRKNIAQDKAYAETYQAFIQTIRLPKTYVEAMCNAKYTRHFYSETEIASMRSKWLKRDQ